MNTLAADVIVIGGGPSGVAAATELRRQGVEKVMLLDRDQHLGGATRHCSHSPFGMREFGRVYFGAAYGHRLAAEAQRLGVIVKTGHSVVSLHDDARVTVACDGVVSELSARRIIVATGARESPRSARMLPGDRPVGVITTGTLQSYVAFHGLMPFSRPLIVGSELVTLSAVLTCLMHGARPVALIEPLTYALARVPLTWFPGAMGIPFMRNVEIVDIRGTTRVEAVTINRNGVVEDISCDGVLLTGRFVPEASLFLQSAMGIERGSKGPAIDQEGRCSNPLYFACGNILRGVESGGWAFREGRTIGGAVARDIARSRAENNRIAVAFDSPLKLVVPGLVRTGHSSPSALKSFQIRFDARVTGELSLELDGARVWAQKGEWIPERRVLAPMPDDIHNAKSIRFHFREG